jgi:Ca2+-binding RTX toxin-like protein
MTTFAALENQLFQIIDGTLLAQNGTTTTTGTINNDIINSSNGKDIVTGGAGQDNLLGGNGKDILTGGSGGDVLVGTNAKDILFGSIGDDILTGGRGKDMFVFSAGQPYSNTLGIDTITDFNKDAIVLDKGTFGSIQSVAGYGFNMIQEFAVVTDDVAAASSNAIIVYNSGNGHLYYNSNGSASGFGDGGQFASLSGSPSLNSSDFILIGNSPISPPPIDTNAYYS